MTYIPSVLRRAAVLGVVLALSACADEPPPRRLTGIITEVRSSGLTRVDSFTLRSQGETYEIHLADDAELEFPPAHLSEHQATGDPVRVAIDERGDELYAVSVEDAP